MTYFPDTSNGLTVDSLPQAVALSSANTLVLRQGGFDVQMTLSALQAYVGGLPASPGAPGAPLQGSTSGTSIVLSWAAPTSGGAVASYVLQQSLTGLGSWTAVATPTTAGVTVNGLAAGTGYDFRVAGTNAGGTGAYSGLLVNALTSSGLVSPNTVTGLSMTLATSNMITLAWSESGGSPTARTVTQRTPSGTGPYVAASGSFGASGGTVTGLLASSSYDFQVVESNASGSSGVATLSNVSTTAAAPGQVSGLAAVVTTSTSVNLTWTNAAGATAWLVSQRTPSGTGSYVAGTLSGLSSTTGATVTGLAAGQGYDFQVIASNSGGTGPAATVSGVLMLPDAVTSLAAGTIGATTVALTWTNAASATGWTVTQRTPSGSGAYSASTLSVAASATGATVSGLTTGSSYDFQVTASNATGTSPQVATLSNVTPSSGASVTAISTASTPTAYIYGDYAPTFTGASSVWVSLTIGGTEQAPRIQVSSSGAPASIRPNSSGTATVSAYAASSGGSALYTSGSFTVAAGLGTISLTSADPLAAAASTTGTFTSTAYQTLVGLVASATKGSGYTSAPTVSFSGGAGSGAAATAIISGGQVTGFTITNPGSGYTSVPTVTLTGGGFTSAASAPTAQLYSYLYEQLVNVSAGNVAQFGTFNPQTGANSGSLFNYSGQSTTMVQATPFGKTGGGGTTFAGGDKFKLQLLAGNSGNPHSPRIVIAEAAFTASARGSTAYTLSDDTANSHAAPPTALTMPAGAGSSVNTAASTWYLKMLAGAAFPKGVRFVWTTSNSVEPVAGVDYGNAHTVDYAGWVAGGGSGTYQVGGTLNIYRNGPAGSAAPAAGNYNYYLWMIPVDNSGPPVCWPTACVVTFQ